jgi:hypothetical protein
MIIPDDTDEGDPVETESFDLLSMIATNSKLSIGDKTFAITNKGVGDAIKYADSEGM